MHDEVFIPGVSVGEWVVYTANSIYKINASDQLMVRVVGSSSPTNTRGAKERAKPYTTMSWFGGRLLVDWHGDGKATLTSPVRATRRIA